MFILIFLRNGYKPQVTIQPVSANNLQTLLSVHLSFYTFEVVHYSKYIYSKIVKYIYKLQITIKIQEMKEQAIKIEKLSEICFIKLHVMRHFVLFFPLTF